MRAPRRPTALAAHGGVDCYTAFVIGRSFDAQGKISHASTRIRRFYRKELRVDFD
jgi:hypothetical protein